MKYPIRRNAITKLYVRESPQQQYHYQSSDHPILPKNLALKPGDVIRSHWSDYHIDRVTYSKNGLIVYATKTELQKCRGNTYYKKKRSN